MAAARLGDPAGNLAIDWGGATEKAILFQLAAPPGYHWLGIHLAREHDRLEKAPVVRDSHAPSFPRSRESVPRRPRRLLARRLGLGKTREWNGGGTLGTPHDGVAPSLPFP